MLTASGDVPAYKKLAAFNSIILDKSNQTCLDYSYENMIKELKNFTWSSSGGKIKLKIHEIRQKQYKYSAY